MTPQNLGLLFRATVNRFSHKKALLFKQEGKYTSWSWRELADKVQSIASSLLEKGLKSGDRIAILSENRPEWVLVDLAAQHIGLITVPIYPSLSSSEIQYILADASVSALAISNKSQFEKIPPTQSSLPALKFVIGFEPSLLASKQEMSVPLISLKELEKKVQGAKDAVRDNMKAIPGDAVASIIYTSGTTGVPKGVMLTHSNFIHNVVFSREALRMSERDVHLSFLPLSHVFERMAGYYLMIYIGATIAYAENLDTVPQNLLEIRPTFILGVPRFYEKIMARVSEAVAHSSSFKKKLFSWARGLGKKKREWLTDGRKLGAFFWLQYGLADWLVYRKVKRRLGGRLRFCVAGGAALPKEIAEFFYDLGVMIYEGYGLTETSPVISANREGQFKFGTVGIPLKGVEVNISEEGEVMTKSPCVMKGYWNKEEETKKVLKDGWFYTGDLGNLDSQGFLTITGRKKELIVTSGGKKVAAAAIEALVEKDPSILRCVLFGEGRKFITALIVPRQDQLTELARNRKIAFQNYAELLKDSKIYQYFESRIEEATKDLANFEKIKYFALLERDFTQEAGELTPTLKVKRDALWQRYQSRLLPFYVD